jgi:probable HAF family extracellular repeat protein
LKSILVLTLLVANLVSGASYTYAVLGVQGADANSTSPNGINDSRTVVGTYSVTQQCVHTYCSTPYGFIWNNGTFTSISFPGSNSTVATAINNSGQIVGNYTTTALTPQKSNGFIDTGGTFTTLNVSGAVLTQPEGINNSGQVVGYFESPSNQSPSDHAFLYSGGAFTTFDNPGATYTEFQSINDSGTITGVAGIGGTTACFVYSAGVFTTIKTSAYPAYFCNSAAINNSGQIALTLGTRISGLSPLLGLIDANGVFTAISVPGSTVDSAAGLNNLGDVVGLEYTGLFYGYAAFASANNGATLTSLNPNGATVGGATFTLTVNGSSFVSGATVQWNGSPLSTSFVNGTQLTAAVPGSLITNVGSASVTVVNPGTTASNALTFSINPVTAGGPVITSLSPGGAIAGGSTFNLTVFGSNFLSSGGIFSSGATVQWNGSPLLTSFVNGTQLTATVSGALITDIGSASITVQNPGGAVSNSATFTIAATSPPVTITAPPTLPLGAVGTFYSQSLSAVGGIPPYSWSLVSGALPSGLSLSNSGRISGNPTSVGTLSFTMKVVDSASSSATQTFSLTIGSSQSFTSALRVPQIVDGAGWNVRFAIINTDQVPVTFTFQFWSQNGSLLPFPILNGTPGVLTGTLAPGASFFAQSPGTSLTLQQGWAEIASSGQIGVTTIYQFNDGSPRDSVGTEIATLSGNSILLPFDNTQNNVTAVAIANTNSTQALTVSMLFETDGGAQSTSSLVLQPHTQQTFVAPTLNPKVAGSRGSIKFTAPTADIAVVGLEFNSTGQFTSLGTFQ